MLSALICDAEGHLTKVHDTFSGVPDLFATADASSVGLGFHYALRPFVCEVVLFYPLQSFIPQ